MAKTTYIATAPDGSQHRRATDRTYTHAVLVEGPEGWKVVGFCGRPDLAEKKRAEHPGSLAVEVVPTDGRALGDEAKHDEPPEATESTDASERVTVGATVRRLLIETDLGYVEIVDAVKARFPKARTSTRSVASVASALRRDGEAIPFRRRAR